MDNSRLTSQSLDMIVKCVTRNGSADLSEIEAERFLNAITRLQSQTPTGALSSRSTPYRETRA